ncbi:MAG: hypothetical protein NC305_04645 [Lachnospiraceae bacterium]|nr:hypothetical protein [Muribaculum sp.]MCM1409821.1 hypothetical protein [Lachnospiraceae bacterium]
MSIIICLVGLLGSIAGSVRYAMRDDAIDKLAVEWNLSQMQITKIAANLPMSYFLMLMMETPGIDEMGTGNLIDAEYTRDFIAQKLRDYRDDLLRNNKKGKIEFSELVMLDERFQEAVSQDLHYSLTEADLERYEMIWDNLAISERSMLENYRSERPILFAIIRVVLSGWFLALAALSVLGGGIGIWYLYGRSFRGHGVYGVALIVLGVADCVTAALCGSMAAAFNRMVDIHTNLTELALAPVSNVLWGVGAGAAVLGVAAVVLSRAARK